MDSITPTKLRDDIYHILDLILKTGIPVTVLRKGKKLRISVVEETASEGKLSGLKKRKLSKGDPEDFVSWDWSKEWSEDK